MNEEELIAATKQLIDGQKYSMASSIRSTEHDHLPSQPGVYAIWDTNGFLIYVGYAGTSTPSRAGGLCGLRDRLDSHWRGTLTASSLALAIWFLRVAPDLPVEANRQIAKYELNPSSKTQAYIRGKLFYSYYPTVDRASAQLLERYVHAQKQPPLNNFKSFMKAV